MRILPASVWDKFKLAVLFSILFAVAYFSQAQAILYWLAYSPQEGDVVFQSHPHSDLIDAIEGITHSPYSHAGVVLRVNNQWVVLESVGDVRETPLLWWIQRGRGAAFAVFRLKPEQQKYLPEFRKHLLAYKGYSYDYDYKITDEAIYCSELPYQAYLKASGQQMGKLERLGDLDWKPYESFIRSVQGNALPLDRLMITPRSLSEAAQLQRVWSVGY